MASERFLVTGANGCIGTWVTRQLVREGAAVAALDIGCDINRWSLAMTPEEISQVARVTADVADMQALERAMDQHRATHVIHLAALQVPFCRADPPLGARVNVLGTVNVFEAVKRRADRIGHVVYASSIAAHDELENGHTAAEMSAYPGTLYGVFKRANEGTAHVYWLDHGLPSVGLRPHTVFGPGRDQGLTSTPTEAMLAAAAGLPYRIPFGGRSQLQYAPDVAAAFIAAARAGCTGADVHNLAGRAIDMGEVIAAIERATGTSGLITHDELSLPFPEEADGASLRAVLGPLPETPFDDAVRETIARFEVLLASGGIEAPAEQSAA